MKAGLGNLMKQAQKMQEDLQRAQQELANAEVTGESGGGMVKLRMNGRHQVLGVTIEPGAMEDREMLEDLVTAAANDAAARIERLTQERFSGMTSGLNIPGLKLPF
ncbi:MAG: YbaB/EbfC family nucleoid-associated protein [Chromatiales bacterium]|nr:YbaB/EbfC family nucleoid-associated protein [Chromatiales bacterium]